MQRGSASSILLVCLLLLAQWTGFSMVLCIAGPGHVEMEHFNAPCCAPHPARGGGMHGDAGAGCIGCTDIDTGSAYAAAGHDAGYALVAQRAHFSPVHCEATALSLELRLHSHILTAASPLRC